jgi:hypothetical protein
LGSWLFWSASFFGFFGLLFVLEVLILVIVLVNNFLIAHHGLLSLFCIAQKSNQKSLGPKKFPPRGLRALAFWALATAP